MSIEHVRSPQSIAMRILTLTNTYLPSTNGVARAVSDTTAALRGRGHEVLVVAPEQESRMQREDVVRVPAVCLATDAEYAVPYPVVGQLAARVSELRPQIVHTNHPFFLGDTALRIASTRGVPLVLTYHTRWGRIGGDALDSELVRAFLEEMNTDYANRCDWVVAPSTPLATALRQRGVRTPVSVIPTGTSYQRFSSGDRPRGRRRAGLPESALVVGHVGRLAPEKNLDLLAQGVAAFLVAHPRARFLLVGAGPCREQMLATMQARNVAARVHATGELHDQDLVDAYAAMDVFAFASRTETQGLVLAESLAAGIPIVAVDDPVVRESVDSRGIGRLVEARPSAFARALADMVAVLGGNLARVRSAARKRARELSLSRTAGDLERVFSGIVARSTPHADARRWHGLRSLLALWGGRGLSAGRALVSRLRRHPGSSCKNDGVGDSKRFASRSG